MLKRIQRVNKEAFKFQFTISYQELVLDCYNKWYPKAVYLSWSRRDKVLTTKTHPVIADPDVSQRFLLTWPIPENQVAVVTLFRSSSSAYFEPKHWVFEVYEGDQLLGTQKINLSENASTIPKQLDLKISLTPTYCELKNGLLHLTISSSLIRHGKATDDDRISLDSFRSLSKVKDDSEDDLENSGRRSKLKAQMFRSFRVKKSKPKAFGPHIEAVNNVAGRYNLVNNSDEYETSFGDERRIVKNSQSKRPISPTPSSPLSSLSSLNPSSSSSLLKPPPSLSSSSSSKPPLSPSSPSTNITDPSEELLLWCRSVTKDHHLITPLDNLTTAWRSGVAFCAIIHHFKPHLIDYDSLDPSDTAGNCKIAFEAGEKVGVPRVMEPDDMVLMKVPDKLSIITYIFQLKSLFAPSSHPQPSKTRKRVPNQFKFSSDVDKKSSRSSIQPSINGFSSQGLVVDGERNKGNCGNNVSIKNGSDFRKNSIISSNSNNDIVIINSNTTFENGKLNLQNLSITEENPSDITNSELNNNETKDIDNQQSLKEEVKEDLKTTTTTSDHPISPLKPPPSPSRSPLPPKSPPKSLILPSSPSSFIQSPSTSSTKTSTRHKIMTRKQLYNPFDSDSEEDNDSHSLSIMDQPIPPCNEHNDEEDSIFISENSDIKPNGTATHENNSLDDNSLQPQTTTKSRQDILKDRARILISEYAGRLKYSPKVLFSRLIGGGDDLGVQVMAEDGNDDKELERQRKFRYEARRRIAEMNKSPTAVNVIGGGDDKTEKSLDHNYYFNDYGDVEDEAHLKDDDSKDILGESDTINNTLNTQESTISNEADKKSSYLAKEVRNLEKKQQNLNEVISRLEGELRRAIQDGDKKMEITMLKEWFSLVNYKNAMSRRQDQLSIEQDEEDLEKRFTFLSLELRSIMELAEWEKTDEVRGREKMLMGELVEIVDKRDEMVRMRDQTEQQIDLDEQSQQSVKEKLISRQEAQACLVM